MKIFSDKTTLKKKLTVLGKALGKEAEGYGGYIIFKADGQDLYAYTNDGSLAIEAKIDDCVKFDKGESADNVLFKIDGKLLANAIGKSANDDDVELDWNAGKNALTLVFKGGKVKLATALADEPIASGTADAAKAVLQLTGDDFATIKAQVVPFVNPDIMRASLKGVNLQTKNGNLVAVGTDGYKLARVALGLKTGANANINVSVPVAAFEAIAELVGNAETVDVYGTKQGIQVAYDDITITARAYGGDYVNYDKIIPTDFDVSFGASRSEAEEAVARTLLFNNLSAIRLSYDGGGELNVACTTDLGETESLVEAVGGNGGPCAMYFNPKYLMLAIKAAHADKLVFNWTKNACVITDANAEFMILPVRNV